MVSTYDTVNEDFVGYEENDNSEKKVPIDLAIESM